MLVHWATTDFLSVLVPVVVTSFGTGCPDPTNLHPNASERRMTLEIYAPCHNTMRCDMVTQRRDFIHHQLSYIILLVKCSLVYI
jgi:hypothetical protein